LFHGDYADLDKCPECVYDRNKGKRMVEMIIMLITRTSPARSEARRRRLTEGSCEGGMVFLHHSSAEKMVRNTKGGPTLALA
jgi:hypothetical protein